MFIFAINFFLYIFQDLI